MRDARAKTDAQLAIDKAQRIDLLECAQGLSDEKCAWAGCTRKALLGRSICAQHYAAATVRATQDVDLLIDADLADPVDRELKAVGYQCLHRSADAANYLRGDQRLDFLYAHRPAARQFLQSARELQTPFGALHVVSAEGLIAFTLQGLVNDPRRTQDLEDIRALVRANRDTLKLAEVREVLSHHDTVLRAG